jgi:hypothetical protein
MGQIGILVLEDNDKAHDGKKATRKNNKRLVALAIRNQVLWIFTDKPTKTIMMIAMASKTRVSRKDTEEITAVRILGLEIERRKVELEECWLKMEEERMQLGKARETAQVFEQ